MCCLRSSGALLSSCMPPVSGPRWSDSDPVHVDTLGRDEQDLRSSGADPEGALRYEPDSGRGFRRDPGSSPPQVLLTPEDMRVLRECNKESFYRRCLPLVIAGNALTHAWLSRGSEPVSRGKRVAAYTFVTVSAWIVGKMSYRRVCEDKILTSGYSSKLVDAIRKRRGLSESEFDSGLVTVGSGSSGDSGTPFNWKEDDRLYAFEDERTRSQFQSSDGPTGDKPFYGDDDATGSSPKEYTSYDALRQRNRAPPASSLSPAGRTVDDRRF